MDRHRRGLVLAVVCACLAPATHAGDAVAPKTWKDSAEASFVNANGNSKTTTTSAKETFSYAFDSKTTLDVEGGALGAKSKGAVTAEQYYGGEKLQRKWDDKDYVYQRYRWDKNRFAGILTRHDFSVGVGRDLWTTPTDSFKAEGGPGFIHEERIGERHRDFASARAYAKYEHDFSAAVKFTQDGEFIQSLKDKRDNRVNTETAFISALSTVFSLKTSFIWNHVSQPPPNSIKDDTTTSVALIANF